MSKGKGDIDFLYWYIVAIRITSSIIINFNSLMIHS